MFGTALTFAEELAKLSIRIVARHEALLQSHDAAELDLDHGAPVEAVFGQRGHELLDAADLVGWQLPARAFDHPHVRLHLFGGIEGPEQRRTRGDVLGETKASGPRVRRLGRLALTE